MTHNDKQIRDLLDGALSWQQLHQVMSSYKDANRFEVYLQVLEEEGSAV